MKFDFESAYRAYPRKEGKATGMKKLEKTIKTEEEYTCFMQAVNNYATLCKQQGRELQYIKLFSTFCNHWKDYADAEDLGLVSTASKGLKLT